MLDYRKIEVLPQVLGICWFNSILINLLYSQGLRKIVKKSLNKLIKTENNKFIKTLKYLIDNNYTHPENILKLFRGRFTLEFLLFKYIELYNKRTLNDLLKKKSRINIYKLGGVHYNGLISILKELKINFKDLYYYDNYLYEDVLSDKKDVFDINETEDDIDTNKNKFDEPPDVLVLFNENIFSDFNKYQLYFDMYSSSTYITLETSNRHKYHIDRDSGIPEYKEEITFNGVKYKLDSCFLLNNKNSYDTDHVISGITYNNESFVYNGWTITNENKSLFHNRKACPLFKKDWKREIYIEESDFCISPYYCDLPISTSKNELCFNFNKGHVVLIYVKVEEKLKELSKSDSPSIVDDINSSSIKYSSQSLKEYLQDYFNLKDRTINDLKNQLQEIGYDRITINKLTSRNIRYNLEEGYKSLFKVKETDTDELIVKKFIVKLLKKYIKDNYLFNYINLFKINENDIKTLDRDYLNKLNEEAIIKLYNYLYKKENNDSKKSMIFNLSSYIDDILNYKKEKSDTVSYYKYDLSDFVVNKKSKEELKEEPKLINKYFDLSKFVLNKNGGNNKKRILNKYR